MSWGRARGHPELVRVRQEGLAIAHASGLLPDDVVRAIAIHRVHHVAGREACEQWGPGSSVSRVRLSEPSRSRELDLAVKWVRWRGARGALSDLVYESRSARAVRGAARLSSCGVARVEPLAYAERRRFGLVVESFLLTRFCTRTDPLAAALPVIASDAKRRRALAVAVGDLIGALHAAGLHHPDLKHSNLLVGPAGEVAFADLDALVPARRLTWRRRVRALGQLEAYASDLYPWLPRSDRMRFLSAYLRHQPKLRARRRALIVDVRGWVECKLASWARQERPDRGHFPLAPRSLDSRSVTHIAVPPGKAT